MEGIADIDSGNSDPYTFFVDAMSPTLSSRMAIGFEAVLNFFET
jgi:hypothetical protein